MEKDYTRALSLSRLAYELESLLIMSPTLAAALLSDRLPLALRRDGDRVPGLGGARLVGAAAAANASRAGGGIYEKTTRGSRIYLATPRLIVAERPAPGIPKLLNLSLTNR